MHAHLLYATRRWALGLLASACLSALPALPSLQGQPVTSPYTAYGIGELLEYVLPHQSGMGQAGLALLQSSHIQDLQPALLAYGRLTHLQLSIASDSRNIQGEKETTTYNDLKLGSFTIALPVLPNRWGLSLGLSPYSHVAYQIRLDDQGEGGSVPANHTFQGSGGLNRIHLAQGLRLGKGIYVGASAHYYFGSVEKSDFIKLNGPDDSGVGLRAVHNDHYRGFGYSLGLCYTYHLTSDQLLNIGFLAEPAPFLERQTVKRSEYSLNAQSEPIPNGISITGRQESQYRSPSTWGIGIGYEVLEHFMLGMDLRRRTHEGLSTGYKNHWQIAIGGAYIPDARSLKYLSRLPYRLGLSWKSIPYRTNQADWQDISLSIGTSFHTKMSQKIDVGLRLGTRGTVSESSVQEHYIQAFIGATLSSKWFIKRRYE